MNRHIVIFVFTLSLLLGLCACKKNVEELETFTPESASAAASNAVTEVASGVVDSIFDNVDNLEESVAETTDDAFTQKDSQVTTQPTESEATIPADNNSPTSSTETTNATEATTRVTEDPTVNPEETMPKSEQDTESELTEFEKYNAMSGEEQMAFMQSFETIEAFFTWLNNAKAEYEAANPGIEISGGEIDVGEIIGK